MRAVHDRVRPSYRYFVDSFAMKVRAWPYGSYDKSGLQTTSEKFQLFLVCRRMK